MSEPYRLLDALEGAFDEVGDAYVYTGRASTGALLVKWKNDIRVLFAAWGNDQPVGHKKLQASAERYNNFRSYHVDSCVFLVNKLRPNAYCLIDEFKLVLIEASIANESVTLLGSKNLPEGMLPVIISRFKKIGYKVSYHFDGLLTSSINSLGENTSVSLAAKPPILKVFISYSWDSDEHQRWVIKLASDLRRNGVNVIIDEWDLAAYGNDLHVFMESGVRDSDYVLIICTPNYAKRANNRQGGVGTESILITGEYYSPEAAQKFVPILVGKKVEGVNHIPTYLKTKLGIAFENRNTYEDSLHKLLRHLVTKPRFKKPELGSFPHLPSEEI